MLAQGNVICYDSFIDKHYCTDAFEQRLLSHMPIIALCIGIRYVLDRIMLNMFINNYHE